MIRAKENPGKDKSLAGEPDDRLQDR